VKLLTSARLSLWIAIIGAITLYAFFSVLASIGPSEVGGLAMVVAAFTALFTLRNLRVAREMTDRGGDPLLRLARNRARERRGF
jgi:hypothetical protein